MKGVTRGPHNLHLCKQPEIVLCRHVDDFHVVSDDEDRYFLVHGDHYRALGPWIMVDKMVTLSSLLCAAGGLKYFDLNLIGRRLDTGCHTANSMGVKPISSFRAMKTPCISSRPASRNRSAKVPSFAASSRLIRMTSQPLAELLYYVTPAGPAPDSDPGAGV